MKITTKDLRRIIKEEMYMLQNEADEERLSDEEKPALFKQIIAFMLDNPDEFEFTVQALELAASGKISLAEIGTEFNKRMNADKSGETEMNFGLKQVQSSDTYKRVWRISQHIMKAPLFGENEKFEYLRALSWQYVEELICLIPNFCNN